MRYHDVREARFLSRPNRFIAHVELDGKEEVVHVKNTGRCRELLTPGARVWLAEGEKSGPEDPVGPDRGAKREPAYQHGLPGAQPGGPGMAGGRRGFFPGRTVSSRNTPTATPGFDLYAEAEGRKILMEVKGVTLEEEGVVRFPDAPSQRAVRAPGGTGPGPGRRI